MRCAVALLCLTGCHVLFPRPEAASDDAAPVEDAPPTPGDSGDPLCFGQDVVQLCLNSQPAAMFQVSGTQTISTTDLPAACSSHSVDADTEDPGACVIAADVIVISGELRVVGDHPVVLFGLTSVTITGSVDVSSGTLVQGAGALAPIDCQTGIAGSTAGGAGGSFGALGGKGGSSINGTFPGALPGPAEPTPTRLRGGCPGGNGTGASAGNVFGDGGGAIAILSQLITISGTVNASGAGARGGNAVFEGGGGGGSGGMILLDGSSLFVDAEAQLFANGGGGGEGATNTVLGKPGGDSKAAGMPGRGGGQVNGSAGGDGGDGGTEADGAVGSQPTNSSGAGGGGGGSAGVIRSTQPIGGGQISPPPS